MGTDKEMEALLHCALNQKAEPDAGLQRKVLGEWKEKKTMKVKKTWAAAAAAACVLAVGIPVGAAVRYLTVGQVAEHFGYDKLMEAFKGEDAIEINETQTMDGYRITLLGVTSGKGLEEAEWDQDCASDGTYLVVAVEKEDGTPMPNEGGEYELNTSVRFNIKSFIGGFDPLTVSPSRSDGGFALGTVMEGVQYDLYGVDNLECFADRPLYVCVSPKMSFDPSEYIYTEGTHDGESLFGETGGTITRNEEFRGVNALFQIQLDPSKADRAKQVEYLKQLKEQKPFIPDPAVIAENEAFIRNGEWKEWLKDTELKYGPVEIKRGDKTDCPFAAVVDLGECGTHAVTLYDGNFVDGIAVYGGDVGINGRHWKHIYLAEKKDDDTVVIRVYEREITEE